MTAGAVKGWCPGALRPMESGDGLIVRLKPTGGIVPLDLAKKIADWSACRGNAQIDLTSRANLQIRGVIEATLQPLQDAMAVAGLLDISPEAEAVRNVIASPFAGLDADAVADIRPVAAALEARLVGDSSLHGLPAKFCWLVDDGGRFGLGNVRADVRFEAVSAAAFVVGLDGLDERFGPVAIDEVSDVAAEIARTFLGHAARRMRDLADGDRIALARLAGEGGAQRRGLRGRNPKHPHPPIARAMGPSLSRVAGEGLFIAGVGLPFGRISAAGLAQLAETAGRQGAIELRLTPWRTILVPFRSDDSARQFTAGLSLEDFILSCDDPRLRVAACVGAPACSRATTDVRADATRLASAVKPGDLLHVSGCAKGCAHPRTATLTLTGHDGRYDLIRDGAPWDTPQQTGLSPADLARGLTKGQAA